MNHSPYAQYLRHPKRHRRKEHRATPDETLSQIAACYDVSSDWYGKLIRWEGTSRFEAGLIVHYGIGLSDRHIFDTGRAMRLLDRYQPEIEELDFLVPPNTSHLPPDVVIERLECAIRCFHDWKHRLFSWNCEHRARLVATNEALSCQVKEMFGGMERHHAAEQAFDEYLLDHAPHLRCDLSASMR